MPVDVFYELGDESILPLSDQWPPTREYSTSLKNGVDVSDLFSRAQVINNIVNEFQWSFGKFRVIKAQV